MEWGEAKSLLKCNLFLGLSLFCCILRFLLLFLQIHPKSGGRLRFPAEHAASFSLVGRFTSSKASFLFSSCASWSSGLDTSLVPPGSGVSSSVVLLPVTGSPAVRRASMFSQKADASRCKQSLDQDLLRKLRGACAGYSPTCSFLGVLRSQRV